MPDPGGPSKDVHNLPPGANMPKAKQQRNRYWRKKNKKYRKHPTFQPDPDGVGAVKPSAYRRPGR